MSDAAECDMALLTQADFDGELDAAQAAAIERHRGQCPACQEAYATLRRTRDGIRREAPYHRAPDALRARVAQKIAGADVSARPRRAGGARWAQMMASFGVGAVAAAMVAFFVFAPARDSTLDQVVADHLRSLQPGHLEDVISTDRHTVKPWFDGRLDFAPPVKDLAAEGFPLDGGRLDYLDKRPVAALVYRSDKHRINLFAWPAAGVADRAPQSLARDGYNVIDWVEGGMRLWAVSDVEQDRLATFVRLWRQAG